MKVSKENIFPEIIASLPEADIPIEGLRAHLLQGENQQIIFMTFENDVEIPVHSHEAQWGIILDGALELIIDGVKNTYSKGDSYFIPKGVEHSARIKEGYKDLTLFNQKDRYKTK